MDTKRQVRMLSRRNQAVVRFNLELYAPLNDRLETWCNSHGWTKRRVIEDAIHCWLNQREMQIKGGKQ